MDKTPLKVALDQLQEKHDRIWSEFQSQIDALVATQKVKCDLVKVAMQQIRELLGEPPITDENPEILEIAQVDALGYPSAGSRTEKVKWITDTKLKKGFHEKDIREVYAKLEGGANIHTFMNTDREAGNWFTFLFEGEKVMRWFRKEWTTLDGGARTINSDRFPDGLETTPYAPIGDKK